MRVSTGMIFETGLAAISSHQLALAKTQQQLSSGRRILTAQDDPVAMARVISIEQTQAANAQFAKNRNEAINKLSMLENVLERVGEAIQNAKLTATTAGNPTLSDADRASLALDLRSVVEELVGYANTSDEAGQYMFAGYRVGTQPYSRGATGVTYAGDQGQRLVQVSDSRQMAVSEPGSEIFDRVRNGNGTFVTTVDPANAGTVVVTNSSVATPGAITGDSYSIVFNVGGSTTYDVIDTTTGATVSSGTPYVSGNAISFAGMRIEMNGAPANGDRVLIAPSTSQSMFGMVEQLAQTLSQTATGPVNNAKLRNGINLAMQNLDQALNHVLTARASVGARLKELDTLTSAGEALDNDNQKTISELRDLDYAQAATRLSQQQLQLQAAQKSFVQVSQLSLFDLL